MEEAFILQGLDFDCETKDVSMENSDCLFSEQPYWINPSD